MSFSGSTDNYPSQAQKPLGIDESRTSTNQQARPVPWFQGLQRMGVTWLGQGFNKRVRPITQDTKKQSITIGQEYWIGCAGLVCLGPVDMVEKIFFNNSPVWTGPLWRSGDYSSITIEGYGVMRFYWGTESQTIDSSLAALATETDGNPLEIHGAYRGQCYFVFDELYLGASVTSAPQIEFILARYPKPDWMTWESNTFGDANALAAASEILENDFFGLGTSSKIATSEADAVASRLYNECFGVSPFLTSEQSAGKTLIEIAETVGAYWVPRADGTLGVGLRRQESTAGIPHFDEGEIMDPPDFRIPDREDAKNEIKVTYLERDQNHKESVTAAYDLASRALEVEPMPLTLKRSMITRGIVAAGVAKIALQEYSRPLPEGKLQILKSSLGDLDLGDLFRFSYPHSGLCQQLARVTRIIFPNPAEPTVEIGFRVEREVGPGVHMTPTAPTVPDEATTDPVPLAKWTIIELPRLPFQNQSSFMALAQRGSWLTSGAYLWQLINGSYQRIISFSSFAQRAILDAPLKWTGNLIDEPGMLITLQGVDSTLDAPADYAGLDLLAKIGDEIFALYGSTLEGPAQYQVSAIRGRLGTQPIDHQAGDEVWIFRMDSDAHWLHKLTTTPQTFKLQPFIRNGIPLSMAEVDPLDVDFTELYRRPYPPADLEVNGSRIDAIYNGGGSLEITWTCFDEFDLDILNRWTESTGDCPAGVIQMVNDTGLVVREYLVEGEALTISNADILDAFGSAPDNLSIRAYQRLDYLNSPTYQEVEVTKS